MSKESGYILKIIYTFKLIKICTEFEILCIKKNNTLECKRYFKETLTFQDFILWPYWLIAMGPFKVIFNNPSSILPSKVIPLPVKTPTFYLQYFLFYMSYTVSLNCEIFSQVYVWKKKWYFSEKKKGFWIYKKVFVR